MTQVQTTVKTYNGNANISFSVDDVTIGSTSVNYSPEYLDTDEDCDHNMATIREKILEYFENVKERNPDMELSLDMDEFNFEVDKIAIYVSPHVK